MNIIIYAIAKNEKKFAERFMRSCAGADGVKIIKVFVLNPAGTWSQA